MTDDFDPSSSHSELAPKPAARKAVRRGRPRKAPAASAASEAPAQAPAPEPELPLHDLPPPPSRETFEDSPRETARKTPQEAPRRDEDDEVTFQDIPEAHDLDDGEQEARSQDSEENSEQAPQQARPQFQPRHHQQQGFKKNFKPGNRQDFQKFGKKHRFQKNHPQGNHFQQHQGQSGGRPQFQPQAPFQKKHPPRGRANTLRLAGDAGELETGGLLIGDLPQWDVLNDIEELHDLAAEYSGGGETINFNHYYELPLPDLREASLHAAPDTPPTASRTLLLRNLLQRAFQNSIPVHATGVLELLDNGHGLLLYACDSYRLREQNVFVPQTFIKRYGLKRGHSIEAQIQPPREGETCPIALRLLSVNGVEPEAIATVTPFTELTPYYPLERVLLETNEKSTWDNLSMRVVDCLTPIGLGQRGLIVAQPRTGKTVLMQGMANAIRTNKPNVHLIVLLVDERPEEVTDFKRSVQAEIISSTFDEGAESHVHAAEMVCEKARRMVEHGQHVVILLDSITRLARAYNTLMPNSGKILSGGVEAGAMQRPKRFFGSARNIEGGGSLTILATALVETGSRMDEVIFEEFKGTGNMEIHLDRALADKRIFPSINFERSGTRKEELLYHHEEMNKIYALRRAMKGVPSTEAMEMLIQRVRKTKSNAEFLMAISR